MTGRARTSQQGQIGRQTGEQRPGIQQPGGREQGPQTQPERTGGRGGPSGPSDTGQYPETGEWVSPGEYGGEPAGDATYDRQPMTARPTHSTGQAGPREHGQEPGYAGREAGPQQPQRSGQGQRGDHGHRGREFEGPTGRQQSDRGRPQTGQGRGDRSPDQYSQRIDTDRSETGQRGSNAHRQDRQERDRQPPMRGESRGSEAGATERRGPDRERERERGEMNRSRDETHGMEEVDIDRSRQSTGETQREVERDRDRDRGSNQE